MLHPQTRRRLFEKEEWKKKLRGIYVCCGAGNGLCTLQEEKGTLRVATDGSRRRCLPPPSPFENFTKAELEKNLPNADLFFYFCLASSFPFRFPGIKDFFLAPAVTR